MVFINRIAKEELEEETGGEELQFDGRYLWLLQFLRNTIGVRICMLVSV